MFKRNSIKFDKNFVKQSLKTIVLRENFSVISELSNKGEIADSSELYSLNKKLFKDLKDSLKNIDKQDSRTQKLVFKLECLHKNQIKRRRKLLMWFKNYIKKIEIDEEERFRQRYCRELDVDCLEGRFTGDFDEDSPVFMDVVDLANDVILKGIDSSEVVSEESEETTEEEVVETDSTDESVEVEEDCSEEVNEVNSEETIEDKIKNVINN